MGLLLFKYQPSLGSFSNGYIRTDGSVRRNAGLRGEVSIRFRVMGRRSALLSGAVFTSNKFRRIRSNIALSDGAGISLHYTTELCLIEI
jgi:hypothetical protein